MALNAVHGLQLAPDDTEIVLERPAPHAPIRTINAHQLARLTHQYNTADVDDSILFPFLHGLEGSNVAQNMFFSQARKRMDRPRVPRYRGLVLVRVDEQGFELDARGNVRYPAGSGQTPQKTDDEYYDDTDDSESDAERYDEEHAMAIDSPVSNDAGPHMHPVAERHPPPQLKTGLVKPLTTASQGSSASSESNSNENYFPSPTHSTFSISQTSPPTTPHSTADGAPKSSFGSFMVDSFSDAQLPNGQTGLLPPQDSTPMPEAERRPSHVLMCSLHPDELLTYSPSGPVFVNPKIPEGISLRNFGIQAPIYATLSDVVVYSPKGRTRAALELAEKFKQAIETKAVERGLIRPGSPSAGVPAGISPEGIVYNVYICTDSFDAFEKHYPHLVAIDSQGNLGRKVDLMEREKEEMRNLTKASEIADGVYLGNTGDVPIPADPTTPIANSPIVGAQRKSKVAQGKDYDFDVPNADNPGGYDICIECHDMASFPTFAQLRTVEDRIRGMEEAWKLRTRVKMEQEAETAARNKQREDEENKRRQDEEMVEDKMELDTPELTSALTASTTSSPDSGSDADAESSSVKVLDGGLGLALDMPALPPSVIQQKDLPDAVPISPPTAAIFRALAVDATDPTTSSNEATPTPTPGISTASRQEAFGPNASVTGQIHSSSPTSYAGSSHPYHRGHGRTRSLTNPKPSPLGSPSPARHHHHHHHKSSRISPSAPALPTLPPRPAPNAARVIHLSFPSSPPATPGTLTSLIPFLHFLHSLAKPRPAAVMVEEPAPISGATSRNGSVGSLGLSRTRSGSVGYGSSGAPPSSAGARGATGASGALSGLSPRMRSQTMLVGGGVGMGVRTSTANGKSSSPQMQQLPQVQLSRPLRILLHAGDGYTETSVLALAYLMLTGEKSLPEAYLELQVQRSRSFFVYGADVGVLRRVEQRLKLEREREREKMAASIAATAASVSTVATSRRSPPSSFNTGARPSSAASNSSSSSCSSAGRGTTTATSNTSPPPSPSSGSKWRWGGLPSSWKSGSLSGAGVSFLNGAGMFASLGSNSNPASPTPMASAGVPSVATEESRRAMFSPPLEANGSLSDIDTMPPLTSALSEPSIHAVPASPMSEDPPDLEAPAPLPTSSQHRIVPSQRPSSLSQSYATGQAPALGTQVRRARASTSPLLPSFIDHETWFNDPKFEGSFPSRVLPFLYLGNLAHAGNAYMLHALGITHVVSVGECALIPPATSTPQSSITYSHNQSGGYQVTAGSGFGNLGHCTASGFIPGRPGTGSLWVEEKEGRIKVLDIKGVCDDGIDSLRPQIAPTVEWIDKARAEGGKILIHCRVGVSRSATVTIAYVMHHLNVSLVDAYLMVRSRRLSVLIQPNMRLLYNLCGWEIELARRKAEAENREVAIGEGRKLNWPFLSREVHILNERYLS